MIEKGYVYILQNTKGNYYIGSTKNLSRRVGEHLNGKNPSTKYKGPWEVIFSQEYDGLLQARRVEYKLKKLKRKDIIDRIVKEQKIISGA